MEPLRSGSYSGYCGFGSVEVVLTDGTDDDGDDAAWAVAGLVTAAVVATASPVDVGGAVSVGEG